jgi:hypothetical protein
MSLQQLAKTCGLSSAINNKTVIKRKAAIHVNP